MIGMCTNFQQSRYFENNSLNCISGSSGVTRVQFSGGTWGCTTFSRGASMSNILYPAASNGDLFFQNSGAQTSAGGTDLRWGHRPPLGTQTSAGDTDLGWVHIPRLGSQTSAGGCACPCSPVPHPHSYAAVW